MSATPPTVLGRILLKLYSCFNHSLKFARAFYGILMCVVFNLVSFFMLVYDKSV